jgi:hypothetical protein
MSITGPANITQSYSGTYTIQNSLVGSYTWTFVDSDGKPRGNPSATQADSQILVWHAPAMDDNSQEPITVTARAQELGAPFRVATFEISVYRTPKIQFKDNVPQVLLPGEQTTNEYGNYLLKSSGGFVGPYQPNNFPNDKPFWEFTGPAYPNGMAGGQMTYTTFKAPSQGIFAGSYTITVQSWVRDTGAGTGMVQGNDSVSILVPTAIEKGPVRVMESRNTGSAGAIDYTIAGMPDGVNYTMRLMDGLGANAVDVTGLPDFGNVTPQAGPSLGGVYNFTYTPPVTATQTRQFYIVAEPDDTTSDPRWGEIYRPRPHGPMMVRKSFCVSGTLVDRNTRQPIAGATVSIIDPHTYIQSAITNGAGQFSFNPLPLNNRYEFWAHAPGYQRAIFSQANAFADANLCDPGRAVIEMAPVQNNNAFVSGTISDVNGNPIGANEAITVTLVHSWIDAGEPRMDFVGEVRTAGGAYYLGLEDVPQDAPQPGVHDYYLIAYRPGFWAAQVLPPGGFPYPNTDLQLTAQFDQTNYGLENIPPSVPKDFSKQPYQNAIKAPLTGGFALTAIAAITDVPDFTKVIGTRPAGFYDRLSGSIAVDSLTQPVPGAELWNDAKDNPEGSVKRSEFVRDSMTLLYMNMVDIQDIENHGLFTTRGARVTLPFDLTQVQAQAFELDTSWVRWTNSTNYVDLQSCDTTKVPLKDILAIDYLGDGRIGWVTFLVNNGKWYGLGSTCVKNAGSTEGFQYPDFDRYEIFGCFIRNLVQEKSAH